MVRRPGMAIKAIHAANMMLRRVAFEIIGAVFGGLTLCVSYAHPWDGFGMRIGGDVFDLVNDTHVPMNTAHWPVRWITPADVQ